MKIPLRIMTPTSRFLAINLGGIGDVIYAMGALLPLRKQWPDAVIDLLVVDRAASVAR